MILRKHLIKILWFGLFMYIPLSGNTQSNPVEICNNAIDDDGDGMIDMNDEDCICEFIEPLSLIPNPSFEEKDCCPQSPAKLECAKNWTQASEATTDYVHTCGWTEWDDIPLPLPIPDGEACVGFRNGDFNSSIFAAGWKEYTGTCLPSPLKAGVRYIIRFHVGFTHAKYSPGIQVAFFGSPDCDNLPFGLGDSDHGCPTNGEGWKKLGSTQVSGVNTWVETEMHLTPSEDMSAIAIGPSCANAIANNTLYYFFDNLILATEEDFQYGIELTGEPCKPNISLKVTELNVADYQWYKEGVALVGETHATLNHLYGNGTYQVRLDRPDYGCQLTPEFIYEKPFSESFNVATICEEETYYFKDQHLSNPGIYIDSLKTKDGCDSVAILDLSIFDNPGDSVKVKIFPKEVYQVDSYHLQNAGEYTLDLTSQSGCDSTVFLSLGHYQVYLPNAFTPNGDGLNDYFNVSGGADLVGIDQLTIFNRWGKTVYHARGLSPHNFDQGWNGKSAGKQMPEGVYMFVADLKYIDGKIRTTSGAVSLIR